MKIIVVGSGMAGLTTAAYLVSEGQNVDVFEQWPEIGGVTATIQKEGYSWDLGPLLLEGFGKYGAIRRVLEELGLIDQIEIILDDRGLEFTDFELWRPEKYQGRWWRRERLKELFPEDSRGLDDYYLFYDQMLHLVLAANKAEFSKGCKKIWHKISMIWRFLKVRKWKDLTGAQILDHFFYSEKVKAVFSGILADFVVKPSEFPGLGIPLTQIENPFDIRILQEFEDGLEPTYHYVKGGCGKLVDLLANYIKAHGGNINTNSAVSKVIIVDNQAEGIELKNGESIPADLVVLSTGVKESFFQLIGKEHLPDATIKHIESLVLMESVLMVHVGVNFDPSTHQRKPLCYYYQTYDIEEAITQMRKGNYHEGKEGFLIYIPSMHSPEMAPSGKHAITIYTVAPDRLNEGDWESRKEELGDKLLQEAERIFPGLREHIEVSIIMTPREFRERILVEHHGFGGLAPIMGQTGPKHQTPIKNLWYVGSQSESGGGVQGAMAGARKAVLKIIQIIGKV